MPSRWLVKTEPSSYSFDDLVREGRTVWEGVANPAARIHLRAMRKGDDVLVYHTGAVKAVVGLANVTKGAYANPKTGDAKDVVVDLVPVRALGSSVSLAVLRGCSELKDWDLLTMSRLSVMPVPPAAWRAVLDLSTAGARGA